MSTLRFSWNKVNCLPQDQSLSVFMVNGLSRLPVPAFASFNLLHLKRCPVSVSWSKYPQRIDRRNNILVNSNYKGFLQYLRGFFAYSALLCDFSTKVTKPILINGGNLMGEVCHYAIKTSLSLNYNFTISLVFLNFKLRILDWGSIKHVDLQANSNAKLDSLTKYFSPRNFPPKAYLDRPNGRKQQNKFVAWWLHCGHQKIYRNIHEPPEQDSTIHALCAGATDFKSVCFATKYFN